MLEIIPSLSSLGGTIVIAAMMLWYMKGRDEQLKQSAMDGHAALRELTKVVAEFSKEAALSRQAMKLICKQNN